jgi:hypothetical protein
MFGSFFPALAARIRAKQFALQYFVENLQKRPLVALPEYFSVAVSLLNLLEESLGHSKPATKLMKAH